MQRVVYSIFYGILWSISMLPMPVLYLLSNFLRFIAQHIIKYRKDVIHNNLLLAFPEKTEEERAKIAKRYYRHLGDLVVETIKSITISEKELNKRFQIDNLDLSKQLYDDGRSVIIFCSHYANWEWSGILGTHIPFKGFGVYKTLKIPHLNKLIKKIRGRFGSTIVTNKIMVTSLYRSFRKGEQTASLLLADQTPKKDVIKQNTVDTFMGIKVPVFTGAETLSKKLDFAAVYLSVKKVKRGYYKASVVPLALHPKEKEDYEITRAFLDEIEKQIAQKPEHYLWSHRRWKHRMG